MRNGLQKFDLQCERTTHKTKMRLYSNFLLNFVASSSVLGRISASFQPAFRS